MPDAAFTPIEGDDRKVASALKKQNASEREGQHDLFSQAGIPVTNAVLAKRAVEIARALPDSLEDLHIHQQRQALELAGSPELRVQKLLADAWCAAFVQPKDAVTRSTAITQAVLEQFGADAGTLDLAAAEELVARPHPPVPLLPLARRVPAHLPRRQRRHATSTRPPAGQAASPASSATRPGSGSSSRSRSSSPPAAPRSPTPRTRQPARRLIAALADSDEPRRPGAVRRVPGRTAHGLRAGATCSASPAVTR